MSSHSQLDSTPPLEGKDRFDALMKLADFRVNRQVKRKEYEWRLSLGLWALIAGSVIVIKTRPPDFELASILVVLVFLHAFYWVTPTSLRNRRDMQMAFYYANRAAEMIGQNLDSLDLRDATPRVERYSLKDRWNALISENWDTRLPIVITTLLGILAFIMIGRVEPSAQPATDNGLSEKAQARAEQTPAGKGVKK